MKKRNTFTQTGVTYVGQFGDNKKHGFTLAEVLVTLGIIGVVSAMTIPALTQNWQKKAYVTQLHKIYNVIQQAFLEDMNDSNAINVPETRVYDFNEETGRDFIQKHFKVIKECGRDKSSGCFADKYRSIDGGNYDDDPYFDGYHFVIAGGPAISMHIDGIDTGDYETDDYLGYIIVDVNGPKGPNINGRDLFMMYFYADGILDIYQVNPACRKNGTSCPSGNSAKQARENIFNDSCKSSATWDDGSCFGKLLNDNWEMNY